MSPYPKPIREWMGRFPRVSGDEPTLIAKASIKTQFSPRERG